MIHDLLLPTRRHLATLMSENRMNLGWKQGGHRSVFEGLIPSATIDILRRTHFGGSTHDSRPLRGIDDKSPWGPLHMSQAFDIHKIDVDGHSPLAQF